MSDPPRSRIKPPRFLAQGAPAAILRALPGARAVGGCVRDAIAGRKVHDVDIAAPLPPEEIARRLGDAGLKLFETGLSHGTLTAVLDGQAVEVTALRRDVVTDGRHAEVEWTTDWREDAARRDFRINAMSCDAAGNLWDYFDGRADLANGRVRFVGDPATRLREDYLRALRFFRFWARYGRGTPDAEALAAIRGAVEGLRERIAPERVWMELKRLIEAPDPSEAIDLMEATGIRRAILPEGLDTYFLRHGLKCGLPREPMLRMAVMVPSDSHDEGLPGRLRWSKAEEAAYRQPREVDARALSRARTEEDYRRLLARFPRQALIDRCWMEESWEGMPDGAARRARLAAMPEPVFPLRGQDLLDLGHPPGARIGALLAELRAWWIEGGCTASREECLAELERLNGAADGPAAPPKPPANA